MRFKRVTYTIMHYGTKEFEDKIPYFLGLGEFQDRIQILALFNRDIQEKIITIGMPIQLVPVSFAPERISYEFTL